MKTDKIRHRLTQISTVIDSIAKINMERRILGAFLIGIGLFCATACGWPPPPCQACYSNWPYCNVFCFGFSGWSCCEGSCCGGPCCGGPCCPTAECKECVNGNCQSACNPAECKSCIGGSCQVCNGDTSKCCDNGTCVDKCTNTGQCDYGELPSGPYPRCSALQNPITGRCDEAEGLICNHLVTIAQNDAVCADCEPNCNKTRICACVEILPILCKTHCYLLVCACFCDEAGEPSYRGDHYECGE